MTLIVFTLAAYAVFHSDLAAAVVCAGLAVWRGYRGPGRMWQRVQEVVLLRRAGLEVGKEQR